MLTRGLAVERQLAPAESHPYVITLEAGDFAEVSIEQVGIDVIKRLRKVSTA